MADMYQIKPFTTYDVPLLQTSTAAGRPPAFKRGIYRLRFSELFLCYK